MMNRIKSNDLPLYAVRCANGAILNESISHVLGRVTDYLLDECTGNVNSPYKIVKIKVVQVADDLPNTIYYYKKVK